MIIQKELPCIDHNYVVTNDPKFGQANCLGQPVEMKNSSTCSAPPYKSIACIRNVFLAKFHLNTIMETFHELLIHVVKDQWIYEDKN